MVKQVLIKNSEGYYAREDGKVVGKTGIILKPTLTKYGYNHVSIKVNGRFVSQRVHRLIAQAFIPNPDNLPEVNHKNGIKTDNRVSNLEWVTSQQNQLHSTRVLGKGVGEDHPMAKITEQKVHEICKLFSAGYQNKQVSEITGVGKDTIHKIRSRETWIDISNQYKFPEKSRSLSVETVEWVCRKLSEGYSSVEIRNESKNPKLTLQVIKGIKGRRNYKWISNKFDF